ncbi:hypothetical protein Q7P37_003811 [Cladosporium fusiforme]
MHRCCTSTAAAAAAASRPSLDLLVRDFASINLRQHRARAFFLHHRSRRLFSTTGQAQEHATLRFDLSPRDLAERKGIDEGAGLRFTGYDGPAREVAAASAATATPVVGEALPLEEGDGKWRDDEDWSAEVEVKELGTISASAEKEGGSVTTNGSRAKAESRLARKQRRVLAGTYKPTAAAAQEPSAAEEGDGRDSVLRMIEGMEGPAVQKAKAKVARADKGERRKDKKHAKKEDGTPAQQGDIEKKTRNPPHHQPPKPKRETWQIQKSANLNKFGNATWQPRKRLSPDTLEGIRALHASDPSTYSTETLSSQFEVSPENIRRILKSKWRPNDEERDDRSLRWERRGVRKWTEMAKLGERPPRRWREMGVGSVKGEPDRRPEWKRGGGRSWVEEEDGFWDGEEFGERIL